jgi:hypothetical protein
VFKRAVGANLSLDEDRQRFAGWNPKHAHKGDLLLFDESPGDGDPITHVGIKLPHGRVLHASDYFNRVVVSESKYIHGHRGARRMR